MNRKQQNRREAREANLVGLRSVLVATGGQAKVEELYRLLDAKEAARFLGLAESTVRDMTYRRELPRVKVGGRAVRYQLLELIGWSAKRSHPVGN